MEQLAQEYAELGFEFLFVFTREAHPAENYPHHTSFEQKVRHAEAFRERFGVTRTILVDDLEGTVHHQFGRLPDMCYLVGKRRRQVLFKADWTNADTLRMILDYQLRRAEARESNLKVGPNYCEFLGFRPRVWEQFPDLLEVNGPHATVDWKAAMEYWKVHPPKHG